MTKLLQHRLKERTNRVERLIQLNAPPVIIGHACLLVAELALPTIPGKKGLVRWIIDFERKMLAYGEALDNPDSDEAKELALIQKEWDDLDFDKAADSVRHL